MKENGSGEERGDHESNVTNDDGEVTEEAMRFNELAKEPEERTDLDVTEAAALFDNQSKDDNIINCRITEIFASTGSRCGQIDPRTNLQSNLFAKYTKYLMYVQHYFTSHL